MVVFWTAIFRLFNKCSIAFLFKIHDNHLAFTAFHNVTDAAI